MIFDDKLLERLVENKIYISASTLNLFNKKYSLNDLTYIVKKTPVSLSCILETQELTAKFCIDYILRLDEKYCSTESDTYINDTDIIENQNITREELNKAKRDKF